MGTAGDGPRLMLRALYGHVMQVRAHGSLSGSPPEVAHGAGFHRDDTVWLLLHAPSRRWSAYAAPRREASTASVQSMAINGNCGYFGDNLFF